MSSDRYVVYGFHINLLLDSANNNHTFFEVLNDISIFP